MMLRIIICGWRCQNYLSRCLTSINAQTYPHYATRIFTDGEGNDRKYLVKNTVDAIESSEINLEDVVVCIDADDFLIDENAFKIIAELYEKNPDLLLTYGSYVNESSNLSGKFCGAYKPGEDFRTSDWRGSHLKTFKYKLWKHLPMAELKDAEGNWLKCCADRAMMVPLMELAGYSRILYVPTLLYCYNDVNPNSVWKTNRQLSIDTRKVISERTPLQQLDKV